MIEQVKSSEQQLEQLLINKNKLIEQGHHQKAYTTFRLYLKLKKQLSMQLTNEQFITACELCNLISMRALKSNQYNQAAIYLKQAHHYSKCSNYMLLVTHSNWGCYYKKINNYESALEHCTKALNIAKKLDETESKYKNKDSFIADCHLNNCAILSGLKKHQSALQHAKEACMILEIQKNDKSRKQVYWIGMFNMAVEYQHLKKYQQSLTTYCKLRHSIMNSIQQQPESDPILLTSVNEAIVSLQKILPSKKFKPQKSCSLDPFKKSQKSSCHNFIDHRSSNISLSKNHISSSSYPIRSTQLSQLPVLTQTQNTMQTLQENKTNSIILKQLKLQNIGIRKTSMNTLCPKIQVKKPTTDRIIIRRRRKEYRMQAQNIPPSLKQ